VGKQFTDGAEGQPGYNASKKNMHDFAIGENGKEGMSGAFDGLGRFPSQGRRRYPENSRDPNRQGFEYK